MTGGWSARCTVGRRGLGSALALVALVGCGARPQVPVAAPGPLMALPPGLLSPDQRFSAPLVGEGGVPTLTLAQGQLPQGLEIRADGTLSGRPRVAGEHQQFTVAATGVDGEPLGERLYTLGVNASLTNLRVVPKATRVGDTLKFAHDWGRPIDQAFGWDPALQLLWPMQAGAGFSGRALAPIGPIFSVVVAGPDVEGSFALAQQPFDARLGIVVQLTWEGAADIDLRLLAEDALQAPEVGAATPLLERSGTWVARHEIAEQVAPGAEAVTLSLDAPPGRYALVAVKAGGEAVAVRLFLAVRTRAGESLVDRRFEALFSDTATGSVSDEMQARHQSYRALGLVELGAAGQARYLAPALSRNPFEASETTTW